MVVLSRRCIFPGERLASAGSCSIPPSAAPADDKTRFRVRRISVANGSNRDGRCGKQAANRFKHGVVRKAGQNWYCHRTYSQIRIPAPRPRQVPAKHSPVAGCPRPWLTTPVVISPFSSPAFTRSPPFPVSAFRVTTCRTTPSGITADGASSRHTRRRQEHAHRIPTHHALKVG